MLKPETLELLLNFRKERDWDQFHSARNLAAALSVEASELLEHFIWASDKQVPVIQEENKAAIDSEIADITILLSYLIHDLKIDIDAVVAAKAEANRAKYPVEKSKGSNKKYSAL